MQRSAYHQAALVHLALQERAAHILGSELPPRVLRRRLRPKHLRLRRGAWGIHPHVRLLVRSARVAAIDHEPRVCLQR
eukprot:4300159-Pyramimonas_sp.AAC.1